MLRYSKFVNFNSSGRNRKTNNVAVLQSNLMPRHEAISSTYVEVFIPAQSDHVAMPSNLEDFLSTLLAPDVIALPQSRFDECTGGHFSFSATAEQMQNQISDQTLEDERELAALKACLNDECVSGEVANSDLSVTAESLNSYTIASAPASLNELFADCEDTGPVSLNDIFKDMLNDHSSLHRW